MSVKLKRKVNNKIVPFTSSSIPSRDDIRNKIIEGLVYIEASTVAIIKERIQVGGGDLDIESPTGVSIVSRLEDEFGCKLLRLEVLGRKPNMSIEFLTDHIEQSLRQPTPLKKSSKRK